MQGTAQSAVSFLAMAFLVKSVTTVMCTEQEEEGQEEGQNGTWYGRSTDVVKCCHPHDQVKDVDQIVLST